MNLDLKAADILVKKYPKLLNSYCRWRPSFRQQASFLPEFQDPGSTTVTDVVLLIGTYEQCQFIMKHMLSQRSAGSGFPKRSKWKRLQSWWRFHRFRENHTAHEEEGGPAWRRCPLDPEEYSALLSGNILRNDPERKALWSVIDTQIASGHSLSAKYLKMAIDSSNTEALVELLDRGWKVNGSWRHCLDTPLQRALKRDDWQTWSLRMLSDYPERLDALVELHSMFGPPALQGPDLETHREIYREYTNARRVQVAELYSRKMAEAATILRERGGRVSLFSSSTWATSAAGRAVRAWVFILHTLLYAFVLPLVLVYATRGVWHDMSIGQKFGFAWLWTLLSYFVPHFWILKKLAATSSVGVQSFWIGLCSVVFLFHHVGLPYLVVRHGWRPIRSCDYWVENGELGSTCRDFTFLLPLIVAGIEFVATSVFLFIQILIE